MLFCFHFVVESRPPPVRASRAPSTKRAGEGLEKTPFKCDKCERTFVHKSSLKKHKAIVHDGIRPHACDQCDKRFGAAQHLKDHMTTHTGERPFACDQCGKAFGLPAYLKKHKLSVHEHSRTFICEKCGKGFFNAASLRAHSVTHGTGAFWIKKLIHITFEMIFVHFSFKCCFFLPSFYSGQSTCTRLKSTFAQTGRCGFR